MAFTRNLIAKVLKMKKTHFCVIYYRSEDITINDIKIRIKKQDSFKLFQMRYLPILDCYIIFFNKKKNIGKDKLYFNFLVDDAVNLDTRFDTMYNKNDNTIYNILYLNEPESFKPILKKCGKSNLIQSPRRVYFNFSLNQYM
jgi:hypothetical protein